MNTFRIAVPALIFVLLVWGRVSVAQPANPALPANASVDAVLDALDQRGKSMREFTADVQITNSDPTIGDTNTRTGKVYFQKRGDKGDARLNVVLDAQIKKSGNSFISVANKIQYVLQDGWLYDLDYQKKIRNNRQVTKPGEQTNLLKLGEGPFPLPIGQSKEDVHKNFDVSLVPPGKDEPANSVHLQLKPLPGTPMAKHFSVLQVWVDRATTMPIRIDTTDAAQSEDRSTQLTHIVVNPPGGLKDADFAVPNTTGWSIHTDKFQE